MCWIKLYIFYYNYFQTDRVSTLGNFEDINKSGRTDGQVVYRDRGRSVGVGPMRSRPIEKRIDTSPYGGSYLSPPPDTNWRRTNSDSALHQSTQEVGQRRQHHDSQILGISFNDKSPEQRPRSCYEDSLVPGIKYGVFHVFLYQTYRIIINENNFIYLFLFLVFIHLIMSLERFKYL